MARPLRKAQARLKLRQASHQLTVSYDKKSGGKAYKRPGSMNPHKCIPTGRKKKTKKR